MAKVKDRIRELGLKPLAGEGGYFRFLHLFGNEAGAIYYLITKDSFSSLHKLDNDEVWFFLEGDRCEQITLYEGGTIKKRILNENNRTSLIKAGEWQATKLIDGEYALFATIMSPHYTDDSYFSHNAELIARYPELKEYI